MAAINIDHFSQQLLDDNFDPIDFLNQIFPNEASLELLPNVAEQIERKTASIDDAISENIRKSSKVGDRSREIVNTSRQLIDDVLLRISKLQTQATDTEHIVEDVCGSIKKYDDAKNNLTLSITTLKRLQMASIAVGELEMMAKQKNYGECADRILALSTLMSFFKDFEKNELLDDINSRFDTLKRQIHNQLSGEFELKLFGQTVDPSVASACRAVDAFGETYRNEIIEMFCSRFLEGYDKSFANSPLSEIDRRYNWLKQRIDYYVLDYSKIFPQEWRVPYKLTKYFCSETKIQIRTLLARSKPTIKEFQHGFEHTAKFEHVLAETFGSEVLNEQGEKVYKPANEFLGIIGGAFAKHTDLYIAGERVHMKRLVNHAKDNILARKPGTIDSENKLLKSGIELVQYIKGSIDKCGGFSVGTALFDLFPVLKDTMLDYIKMVKSIMPTKLSNDESRERDLRLMCVMSNTTFYFCSIIDGLAARIRKSVSEDQKPMVRVDDTKDSLTDYNKGFLVQISRALCDETKPILDQISSGTWQNMPESNIKFPALLANHFNRTFNFLKKWISEDNFALLRTLFVPEWINIYFMAIFKGKQPITFVGTEVLSKATVMIKNVMCEKLTTGNEVTMDLQKKIIENNFDLITNAFKVLASPEDAMAPIYKELFKKSPSKDQFMIIVHAKGLPPGTEQKIANKY
ncbi:hypothetical protein TRFO_08088 [Tritrichomonas foetus]|uniref:Vps53 N-terminal domain-containing protein n=1 Tax=Tritrichomonas foetus TaxID=1144522 RepID=A0A1J4JS86_9EUKA|nr:hypothetical protein TRFO_08088 [Tritrichomonas foetus]|eukprot:OHT00109.1 hypothetical protein TRFO_08088 [Tritrichomonas foetus]